MDHVVSDMREWFQGVALQEMHSTVQSNGPYIVYKTVDYSHQKLPIRTKSLTCEHEWDALLRYKLGKLLKQSFNPSLWSIQVYSNIFIQHILECLQCKAAKTKIYKKYKPTQCIIAPLDLVYPGQLFELLLGYILDISWAMSGRSCRQPAHHELVLINGQKKKS